jgi:hypothetical protein
VKPYELKKQWIGEDTNHVQKTPNIGQDWMLVIKEKCSLFGERCHDNHDVSGAASVGLAR